MNNGVKLRSADWFGRTDKLGFVHRSWMRSEGFSTSVFQGKPVIGTGVAAAQQAKG